MFLHGADFHTAEAGCRKVSSHTDRIVQLWHVNQEKSAELLFGLGEWPIGGHRFALSDLHCGGCLHRMERGGGEQLADFLQFVTIGHRFIGDREALVAWESIQQCFFDVDQAEVFHVGLLMMFIKWWNDPHMIVVTVVTNRQRPLSKLDGVRNEDNRYEISLNEVNRHVCA